MCLGQTELGGDGETIYYTGGTLDCNPASCRFELDQCTFCGDGRLNGMELCEVAELGPSCEALGEGTGVEPLQCAPDCLGWDTSCCEDPPPERCR